MIFPFSHFSTLIAQLAGELGDVMALDDIGRKAFALRRMILRLQKPLNAIADCPKPVIAATFGGNIGGALDFLSACDIRYASNCSWFTIKGFLIFSYSSMN